MFTRTVKARYGIAGLRIVRDTDAVFRAWLFDDAKTRVGAAFMQSLIWFGGAGTVLTVLALLLCAGWNETAYYPSPADMQSSLTIYNSSSSLFTLKVMSIVSLLIPFVAAYIWYAWRAMNRKPITREEIRGDDHQY